MATALKSGNHGGRGESAEKRKPQGTRGTRGGTVFISVFPVVNIFTFSVSSVVKAS